MFILLLLLSGAGCEWVEISQNHYRKEPIHKVLNFEHTTKSNTIYRNHSVTEKQWHRGAVDKVSNLANIRRVQHPSVKTNSLKTRPEDKRFNNNFNDHTHTMEAEYDFITIKPNIQKIHKHNKDDDVLENQNKVTTIRSTTADIRQVQYPNSKPIKKLSNAVASIDRRTQYDEKRNEELNDVFNANYRKQAQINKPLLETDKLNFNENDKFYTIEKPNFNRGSLDDEVNLDVPNKSQNIHLNYSITKEPNAPKIKLIQREENDYVKENNVYKQATSIDDKIKYKPHDTKSRPLEEYFDSRNHFKNPTASIDKNTEEIVNGPNPQNLPDKNKDMEIIPSMDDQETRSPNADDFISKDMNVVKGNSIKGIWKLIKVVADTIYKNTHRSFKSKIKYLEGLKTTILTSIEDQIDSAWPDDVRGAPTRHSRAAQPRGHVEFPSSESTLMTISFLTFAVFLIKLVLQVIHTYKNKTMMVTPAVVAAVGRAAAAFRTPS
ncbi:uncharacterized protein LOC123874954 [Maniola jurtina]|uniref:uncharacterized protein LOC123874954 n=1 Tax=Maniola jurtina TaxID=191418 RepID=UPI001E68DFFB|nr:uncharacterized protein LOC123874954 [Maniola jurtina]